MASRKPRPEPRWRERLAKAATPEQQLAAAHDALTAGLALFARDRRDVLLSARCKAEAHALMREVADYLTSVAEGVYGREREIRNTLRRGDSA